jgi:hypothetical protein
MSEVLKIKRPNGAYLTVKKAGARYDVAVTGGGNITPGELAAVEAYIGNDPDGQATLEKLRAR